MLVKSEHWATKRAVAVVHEKNLRHWIPPSRRAALRRRMPYYARFGKRIKMRLNITQRAEGGK